MAKYRKKPIKIEATQWFVCGTHPAVKQYKKGSLRRCAKCRCELFSHGWVDTLEGGHIVCPSDWIITGIKGEYYPIKDEIFKETYEFVSD